MGVEANFVEAIKYLDVEKGVSGITGDCGFMMYFQPLARANTKKPVFMSALAQLPAVTCAYAENELIAIFTANGQTLSPMRDLIRDECGVDTEKQRFIIVGCEDVPGFEAVAAGGKVDVKAVTPGIIKKAKDFLKEHPNLRAFLMECTELPPYSDALRFETGLPVFAAITACNGFMSGLQDNPHFGEQNWQLKWDGKQEEYTFGENLDHTEKAEVVNQSDATVTGDIEKNHSQILHHKGPKRAKAGSLGVIRLDYNYPPAPGDIDHPGSYDYDVYYRAVPGLTFAMCQSGKLTPEVEQNFIEAVRFLDVEKGVTGITGDCGFMMYFQGLARANTKKPVFMSALAQLPAVTCGYAEHELIAIFTANGETLAPMRDLIRDECGVDTENQRYVIVGCQDVPGFEAVAAGEKVDVKAVTPGMIAKAQQVIKDHPNLRAILMECTELPPYSDSLRRVTGLPVFDAMTGCNFLMAGVADNPRFGLQGWQVKWDGKQEEYTFGENLDEEDKKDLINA